MKVRQTKFSLLDHGNPEEPARKMEKNANYVKSEKTHVPNYMKRDMAAFKPSENRGKTIIFINSFR